MTESPTGVMLSWWSRYLSAQFIESNWVANLQIERMHCSSRHLLRLLSTSAPSVSRMKGCYFLLSCWRIWRCSSLRGLREGESYLCTLSSTKNIKNGSVNAQSSGDNSRVSACVIHKGMPLREEGRQWKYTNIGSLPIRSISLEYC